MRDLVLNHTSIVAPDRRTAVLWLADIVKGISGLARRKVITGTLIRISRESRVTLRYIECRDGNHLANAFGELKSMGERDAAQRLRLLLDTVLTEGLPADAIERFDECEAEGCGPVNISRTDGEPLLLCALTNGIAVSFPSDEVWEHDVLAVRYIEPVLTQSGGLTQYVESVDNLSRSSSVKSICDRHRASIRECSGPRDLWLRHEEMFQHVKLGPDVEQQLIDIDNSILGTVISRLTEMDEAFTEWIGSGRPEPIWRSKVSLESKSVMSQQRWVNARTFRSRAGGTKVFELHARFGSGRIHFEYDPNASKPQIEVGYIGPKLLPK